VFTPYKVAAMWKKVGVDNSRIKRLGWRPAVTTDDGLRRTFAWLRAAAGEAS
jgi:nucleoside-diphosphate-sugar epimerase